MNTFLFGSATKPVLLTDSALSSYINIDTLFIIVVALAVLLLITVALLFNIKSLLNNSSSVQSSKNNSVDHTIAQSTLNDEYELNNNSELVAVITAAISASMGDNVPADGLVVRSIRRVK